MGGKKEIRYAPGIFDAFRTEENHERWDRFPGIMRELGFEMDLRKSFGEYRNKRNLKLSPAKSKREERRNHLYLLEHADRQAAGNFLFSEWRSYTHWAMPGEVDGLIADCLWRIMDIRICLLSEDPLCVDSLPTDMRE